MVFYKTTAHNLNEAIENAEKQFPDLVFIYREKNKLTELTDYYFVS
jgi:hypothetical protein